MTETTFFTLRRASAIDELFLEALFGEVHSADLQMLNLPSQAMEQLLAMQYKGRCMTYATQFPQADDQVICIDGVSVGRLLVDRSNEVHRLVDFAVRAPHRGRGLGTQVLRSLIAEAREANVPLQLQVRVGNRAARLYQRMGFAVTGGDGMIISMEWNAASAEAELEPQELAVASEPVVQGTTKA
jgi:GNAT superfamily N-acetyltransferase